MIEGQEGVSWPQWVALARACEEYGVPALFRSDHYMNLDGQHPEREAMDAWGTLCALATMTSSLRLGTLVSPATFRHPSVLAKLVATADEVSDGRVSLGLGAGWHEREHEAYGFAYRPVRTRMEVLEEQVQVVLGAWGPGPFSFSGSHYRLVDLDAFPKPVQQPHPPLIIGGSGGPRSVALAARYADEYNTTFASVEEIRERRLRVGQACEAAGRDPIPFSLMTGFLVGRGRDELLERARRLGSRIGFTDAEAFLADPPAAWIVGTVDEAVQQLQAIAAAGASRVMCQHLLHDDLETVALLGSELAPRLA